MNRKVLVTIIICGVSLSNCRKTADEHQVPQVSVNRTVAVNLAQYNDLNFIGGWVYMNGGYNGLLLYRANLEDIKAYDRQAPYEVSNGCQVTVDTGSVTCSDTCSGSQWLMLDGQIVDGPAIYPLKEYTTTFDGTTVNITN
ncbi:MAG: hypothetical protein HN542_05055 [Flavobacteriales bacterium]|nr:hypothetical protein [Flavobacteriales bacterium]NCG29575.1 hypothetical protein [Bacteroidota bacterium]MBT3962884.1 hypothetical protein [Flavobacteriales bacterium]MBT4705302.1 hypothetical protein [Flavobacteriales bacterium]MBT4930872.1 hypothetical protein [Flavobacteriales bacterium]